MSRRKKKTTKPSISRRAFFEGAGAGASFFALAGGVHAQQVDIQGFDDTDSTLQEGAKWTPVSDRKIRVGIAGYGVCRFGAEFGFQHHPNVDVVAVTDLVPERCAGLARACTCDTTYPSIEKMIEDDSIEAVFVATDAPSHARHCIAALEHGKHVACAVPAVFGSLEDADALFDAVKRTGLTYMLFETSAYHNDCYAMREIFEAGGFGRMVYSEGEYYHYFDPPIDSWKKWRDGLPPQWYPTHSNGYHLCVTGGSFTEVSCMGIPSVLSPFQPENNQYKNPFATEIALFRTSEGGMARMAVSWDTPGHGGEKGRVRGQLGSMTGMKYTGLTDLKGMPLGKPPLPPGVAAGGHGGSHGHLGNEFVHAILEDRKPTIDIIAGLNLTVSGIVAHTSALKDGELLRIPQYSM